MSAPGCSLLRLTGGFWPNIALHDRQKSTKKQPLCAFSIFCYQWTFIGSFRDG